MRWMKLRELECQTILVYQRIEISMVSLDGFLILTLSALRIIMLDIQVTESTSMDQWTIMLLSITLPWPTQNSLDRMLQKSPLQEKEFKQWVSRTDLNTVQLWNQLKAPFRHHYMQLLSFLIVIFLTNTKLIQRMFQLKYKLTLYLSWEHHPLNGKMQLDHQELDQLITVVKHIHKASIKVELLVLIAEDQITIQFQWPERDLRKFVEKMDGTPTLNLFPNTTNKFMDQWKFHSREFEEHYIHWWFDWCFNLF